MNRDSAGQHSRQAMSKSEGDEEVENGDTAPGGDFQFLTFSNFNDTKAKETKSRVRSHVMFGIHQSKRTGKRNKPSGSIDLDASSLLNPNPPPLQPAAAPSLDLAKPGPDRLGSVRTDPFQQYPIEMNQRTLELYDHCTYLTLFRAYRYQLTSQ